MREEKLPSQLFAEILRESMRPSKPARRVREGAGFIVEAQLFEDSGDVDSILTEDGEFIPFGGTSMSGDKVFRSIAAAKDYLDSEFGITHQAGENSFYINKEMDSGDDVKVIIIPA